MAYVNVPKDLTKVKSRLLGGLSKRQLICFSIGGVVGLPAFFLTRNLLGNSGAMLLMMAVAAPFFVLAMYERDGVPAEKLLRDVLRSCWYSLLLGHIKQITFTQESQVKLTKRGL